jgi:hypothetical protein
VSQDFDALEIMFTSCTTAHVDDLDRNTLDSVILLTFIYDTNVLIKDIPLVAETPMHLALVVYVTSSGID